MFLSEEQHILITKRLQNYFDAENDPLTNNTNSNYSTFQSNKNNKQKYLQNEEFVKEKSNDIAALFVSENNNSNENFDGYEIEEKKERINRLVRFAGDYCRASPNINFKEKYSLLELGWRSSKSSFVVDYDYFSRFSGEKRMIPSIMTVYPILKCNLNLDKESNREALKNLIFLLENFNGVCSFIHLDLMYPQKMLIKIQHQEETGSLKDSLFGVNVSIILLL